MIRFKCSGCGKKLGIPDTLAGRTVACPGCKNKFRVPQPLPPESEAEEENAEVAPAPSRSIKSGRPRSPAGDEDEPSVKRQRLALQREAEESEEEQDETEAPDDAPEGRANDEEEEDEPRRPARKRKKKRRRKESGMFGGMSRLRIGLFCVLGVLGVSFLLALASYFLPILAVVPAIVGALLMILGLMMILVGGVWFLIVAFQDEIIMGLACWLVPFFSLYYLITHFGQEKKPFLCLMGGQGVIFVGFCLAGLSVGLSIKTPVLPAPPAQPGTTANSPSFPSQPSPAPPVQPSPVQPSPVQPPAFQPPAFQPPPSPPPGWIWIHPGMREADVLSRLGQPAEVNTGQDGKDMKWVVNGQEWHVIVANGKVVRKAGKDNQ